MRSERATTERRRWWGDLLVVAAYLGLTIGMTWPVPLGLDSHFAGQDVDVWLNPWATWWTERALLEGQSLYHTNVIFYPQGVSLAFHSFFPAVTALALLLKPWLGMVGAHNGMVILAHALSGYGMFCLVRYLSSSRRGAFFAGLVFAFLPYRMAESPRLHLVSTQWLPLYVLFLIRLLKEGHRRHVLPAAVLFALNGLSGWHLMTLSIFLSTAYLCGHVVRARRRDLRADLVNLALLAGIAGVILAPFIYPLVRETLTIPQSYVGVPLEKGRGNDLLAFFLPPGQHPILGRWVEPLHERVRNRHPAYLGITVLALTAVAGLAGGRRARFWIGSALLSVLLSLGPYLRIGGRAFDLLLPWSPPIVGLLRHPLRFNLTTGFCLAVTGGLGLSHILARSKRRWRHPLVGGMIALLLFEFLCLPFPTTPADVPAYYTALASAPGDGAVLDLPMGRHRSKLYMYYQTVHRRPLVEGHVSRTPPQAYAFIEATPVLRSLLHCRDWALPPADLTPLLPTLHAEGIEVVILHKELVTAASLAEWLAARSAAPDYEDERIAVYATRPAGRPTVGTPQLLENCVAIRSPLPGFLSISRGAALDVPLEWRVGNTPPGAHDLELALADEDNRVIQRHRYRVTVDAWPMASRHPLSYTFPVDWAVPPGVYSLQATLVPQEDAPDRSLTAHLLDVQVLDSSAGSGPAAPRAVNVTWGTALRLHGYRLTVEGDALHLELHWQARRKMAVDYKFFLHLFDAATGELAAQQDVMPRDWGYPTSWWGEREVVADRITLPLTDVPAGTYRVGFGAYDPLTGERLPLHGQPPGFTDDGGRWILPQEIER